MVISIVTHGYLGGAGVAAEPPGPATVIFGPGGKESLELAPSPIASEPVSPLPVPVPVSSVTFVPTPSDSKENE